MGKINISSGTGANERSNYPPSVARRSNEFCILFNVSYRILRDKAVEFSSLMGDFSFPSRKVTGVIQRPWST